VPLERALTLAEPEGYVRIFVDEGPPLARLLHEAASRGIAPGYTRRLLAALSPEPEQPSPSIPQSVLVEPLSERELEVLQHIAEGFTNQEIADRLYLSLYTVKAHARSIYDKLDAHSRTQVVARARDLGILPRA
jgi:LuxR family maltose regulon positive regulatory protein